MSFGDFALTGTGFLLPQKEYIVTQDIASTYDYTTTEIYQIARRPIEGSASPMHFVYLLCVFRDKKQLTYDKLPVYTKELMDSYDMWGRSSLVVDGTGVGAAVFDVYCAIGLDPFKIVMTGGNSANAIKGRTKSSFSSSQFGDLYGGHVPKAELISSLKMHLERQMIANGTKAYAEDVTRQLQHFTAEMTKAKKMTYNNDNPAIHDDFVISAAMACWYHDQTGDRMKRPSDTRPRRHSSYDINLFKEDRETWQY